MANFPHGPVTANWRLLKAKLEGLLSEMPDEASRAKVISLCHWAFCSGLIRNLGLICQEASDMLEEEMACIQERADQEDEENGSPH